MGIHFRGCQGCSSLSSSGSINCCKGKLLCGRKLARGNCDRMRHCFTSSSAGEHSVAGWCKASCTHLDRGAALRTYRRWPVTYQDWFALLVSGGKLACRLVAPICHGLVSFPFSFDLRCLHLRYDLIDHLTPSWSREWHWLHFNHEALCKHYQKLSFFTWAHQSLSYVLCILQLLPPISRALILKTSLQLLD